MHILFFLIFNLANANAEGVKSPYTDVVQTLLTNTKPNTNDFALTCWSTPKNGLYMGVEQRVRIHAPLQKLADIIHAVDQYDQLFPGFKKIAEVSKQGNKSTIYFEQRIPIPFVPNVKYEMLYTEIAPSPDRLIFSYQLKDAGALKGSDGLIILSKVSDTETDYTEYDFFDAEWGLAKIEGDTKLWKDSVEGIYISDVAIKIKAEKPEMSPKDALDSAKHMIDKKLVETCVKERADWKAPN